MLTTDEERDEWERLSLLWACGRATKKQILRCTELDRKAAEPHGGPWLASRPENVVARTAGESLSRSLDISDERGPA